MYSLLHVFPNIYSALKEDTARIETYPLHAAIDIDDVKKRFPRFMVKDYVKSVKGTEFPVYFTQSTTQTQTTTTQTTTQATAPVQTPAPAPVVETPAPAPVAAPSTGADTGSGITVDFD